MPSWDLRLRALGIRQISLQVEHASKMIDGHESGAGADMRIEFGELDRRYDMESMCDDNGLSLLVD